MRCCYIRIRAWELKQQGWKQQDIAEALGVSEGAVSQWMRRVREGGVERLRHVAPPDASPRLSSKPCMLLLSVLSEGAEAFGFQGEVWTGRRVAKLRKEQLAIIKRSRDRDEFPNPFFWGGLYLSRRFRPNEDPT